MKFSQENIVAFFEAGLCQNNLDDYWFAVAINKNGTINVKVHPNSAGSHSLPDSAIEKVVYDYIDEKVRADKADDLVFYTNSDCLSSQITLVK